MSARAAAQRLAVLLGAGIAPLAAWRLLERDGPVDLVRAADSADEIPRILASESADREWACIAAAWRVAADTGAPLAPALERLAGVLRDLDDSARAVEVALAAPRASTRIVLALPPVGLLLGMLLGVDTIGALLGSPGGLVCLGGGIALLVVGARWNRRLLAAAAATDPTPGFALELLGIAVSGGASLDLARARVDAALAEAGLPGVSDRAEEVLDFARSAGVPVARLLRAEAAEERSASRSAAQRRAAELGSRLLLPLGVCVLPSFALLGVAPMLLAVVAFTLAAG